MYKVTNVRKLVSWNHFLPFRTAMHIYDSLPNCYILIRIRKMAGVVPRRLQVCDEHGVGRDTVPLDNQVVGNHLKLNYICYISHTESQTPL